MKTRRGERGFSLLEVILAMTVLVIGALVTLTVMMTSTQRNERTKVDSIGYKACQDMTEALMSMSFADMVSLKTWSVNNATPLTFSVTAAGFPRMPGGQYVQGTYTINDVSNQYGFAANSGRIYELIVRIDYQTIHVAIITRRKDPLYQ